MSSVLPVPEPEAGPLYCVVCNHDGRPTCVGCGGRDGGGGKKPCRQCQEVVVAGAPSPVVLPAGPTVN